MGIAVNKELLTPLEQEVITDLGSLWKKLCSVVGDETTRDADLAEIIVHVHALQRTVMANAAARAYPTEYRTLGGLVQSLPDPHEPMPDICEYCNRGDVTLYGWHADEWCASCIMECVGLPRDGRIEDATVTPPGDRTYNRPFIWQTPDGSVVRGVQVNEG